MKRDTEPWRRPCSLSLLLTVEIIIGVSKMAKSGVLRLTSDKLFLILGDKSFGGGVSLWIELDPIRFFDDYIMDGLSALANEIYIELMFEEFLRALKPAQAARLLKLRLIKKHNSPYLSVDTEVVSAHSDRAVGSASFVRYPRR